MINFCHIMPTKLIPQLSKYNNIHLTLAHLVESDIEYRKYYANISDIKIMDNSAFEMFKENKPMYPSHQLVKLGKMINADYLVLSDYPNEHSSKTIESSKSLINEFKSEGFKTFFVPQSQQHDIEDYIDCWEYALNNPDIDLIGMSIIGAPNAFGVERGNKLQRFLSRWKIFQLLHERKLLDEQRDKNRIHMLGMVDGANEISLVRDFHHYIYSWDSSAAVWTGLHNIKFDHSPTSLINGKFELPVDFSSNKNLNDDVIYNIQYISNLIQR